MSGDLRPQRVQLRRTKGYRKPEGAIVVSRPSKWGNPFKVGDPSPWGAHEPLDAAGAVAVYRYMTASAGTALMDGAYGWAANPELTRIAKSELAGHDLACWCDLSQPCHADILLEIANGGDGVSDYEDGYRDALVDAANKASFDPELANVNVSVVRRWLRARAAAVPLVLPVPVTSEREETK